MRPCFSPALVCLLTAISTGIAQAQSPVAYVYVAQQGTQTTTGPISVYAASSAGKLTPIKGSPFTQTTGSIVGTNGSHFLTVDQNPQTSHQYLRSYNVSTNGAIGAEVATRDMHQWCDMTEGGKLDHTGQFVYVLDAGECGGNLQSFSINKSTGGLTFLGTTTGAPIFTLPVIAGNDKFAYTWQNTSDTACPTYMFQPLIRESSGALQSTSFVETDPTPPAGSQTYQYNPGLATNDPTDHLASVVYFSNFGDCSSTPPQVASYTVEANGNLVSTNTYENMPTLAGNPPNGEMKLNPAGNVLAVAVGTGIQFFHFNGAAPATHFTGIIGTSGFISTMAWDKAGHLYALNEVSGRLHIYTVTTDKVVEASGSPYNLPYCGYAHNNSNCTQSLVVRIVQ
jgi:hypothetical protein